MLQPEFSLPEFVNGAADTQRGAVLFKGLAAEEIARVSNEEAEQCGGAYWVNCAVLGNHLERRDTSWLSFDVKKRISKVLRHWKGKDSVHS